MILAAIEEEFPLLSNTSKHAFLSDREPDDMQLDGLLDDVDLTNCYDAGDLEEVAKAKAASENSEKWAASLRNYRHKHVSASNQGPPPKIPKKAQLLLESSMPASTDAHELQKFMPPQWLLYKYPESNRYRAQEQVSKTEP